MLLLEVVLHVVLHIVPYRSSCYSLRWNFSIKYITKLHHPVKSVSSGESRCMKGGKAGSKTWEEICAPLEDWLMAARDPSSGSMCIH
jgi:hypothetical protein